MALIGTQTLSCPVGAPLTMTFQLDPANATTGQMLAYRNDSGHTCIIRYGIYIVTAATSGYRHDAGITTTAVLSSGITAHTADSVAGYVLWSDGNDVIADNSYFTIYNTGNNDTATDAAGVVGYVVIQMWPVCSVI
jgi:hypothetical protein